MRNLQRTLTAVALAATVASLASCTPRDAGAGEASVADIAASLEGVQLDVWNGGRPSPGGSTTLFVHHDQWAAELYWKTEGWCLAHEYSWTVDDAVSAREFRVVYQVEQEYTDCVMAWGDTLSLSVTSRGSEWLDGRYTVPFEQHTQRTVCSTAWDDPAPCGFVDAAALLPPDPATTG